MELLPRSLQSFAAEMVLKSMIEKERDEILDIFRPKPRLFYWTIIRRSFPTRRYQPNGVVIAKDEYEVSRIVRDKIDSWTSEKKGWEWRKILEESEMLYHSHQKDSRKYEEIYQKCDCDKIQAMLAYELLSGEVPYAFKNEKIIWEVPEHIHQNENHMHRYKQCGWGSDKCSKDCK